MLKASTTDCVPHGALCTMLPLVFLQKRIRVQTSSDIDSLQMGNPARDRVSEAVRTLGLEPLTLVVKLAESPVGRGNICLEGVIKYHGIFIFFSYFFLSWQQLHWDENK